MNGESPLPRNPTQPAVASNTTTGTSTAVAVGGAGTQQQQPLQRAPSSNPVLAEFERRSASLLARQKSPPSKLSAQPGQYTTSKERDSEKVRQASASRSPSHSSASSLSPGRKFGRRKLSIGPGATPQRTKKNDHNKEEALVLSTYSHPAETSPDHWRTTTHAVQESVAKHPPQPAMPKEKYQRTLAGVNDQPCQYSDQYQTTNRTMFSRAGMSSAQPIAEQRHLKSKVAPNVLGCDDPYATTSRLAFGGAAPKKQ